MNTNGRSEWHGGGTRTPSWGEWGGSASGIRLRCAGGVVPLRATECAISPGKDPISRCSARPSVRSGTEWHACPFESARDNGRA